MKKSLLALLIVPLLAAAAWEVCAQASPATVTITLLCTTDSHGHIEPWDYFANKPADLGMAKIATLVNQQRAEAPDALLLDCGDTIEGTPLAYYFAVRDTSVPNPEIAVFNAMGYVAMAVGNHEFDFAEKELWKAKAESHFPWLAANIKQAYVSGTPYFKPYIIQRVEGVRVAIVGFVTPGIPRWEIPAHYMGYQFEPIVESAKAVIPEVRKHSDLVVVIMHSGLDRDPKTGKAPSDQLSNENAAWELARQVPGIDLIFYGHTHREMPQMFVNGVLMAQAKNWGISLARADITMKEDSAAHWTVISKHSRTIPVTPGTPADPHIMKIAQPYQQATQKYLDTPIASSEKTLTGANERYEDGPLVELINRVQMDAGRADVSLATMFYPGTIIPAGPVTVRQAAALYIYENTLYVVEMTGAQLKDALEHAASFYPAWPPAPGEELRLPGYNADSALGVSYVMDLAKPVGDRIEDLRFHGNPLSPNQRLRVAINSYRYTGGGRYDVYKGLPIVYRSPEGIRDLLIAYLERVAKIPASSHKNWKILPPESVRALEAQSAGDSSGRNR